MALYLTVPCKCIHFQETLIRWNLILNIIKKGCTEHRGTNIGALHFISFLNIHFQHVKSTNLNRYFSFNSDLKIVRMKASKLRNKGDPYLSRFPNLMLCRNFLQSLFEIQATALNLNDYRNTKVIKVIRGNE